jgi:hypothetical protein
MSVDNPTSEDSATEQEDPSTGDGGAAGGEGQPTSEPEAAAGESAQSDEAGGDDLDEMVDRLRGMDTGVEDKTDIHDTLRNIRDKIDKILRDEGGVGLAGRKGFFRLQTGEDPHVRILLEDDVITSRPEDAKERLAKVIEVIKDMSGDTREKLHNILSGELPEEEADIPVAELVDEDAIPVAELVEEEEEEETQPNINEDPKGWLAWTKSAWWKNKWKGTKKAISTKEGWKNGWKRTKKYLGYGVEGTKGTFKWLESTWFVRKFIDIGSPDYWLKW